MINSLIGWLMSWQGGLEVTLGLFVTIGLIIDYQLSKRDKEWLPKGNRIRFR